MHEVADISRFESLTNSSQLPAAFVHNGFVSKVKTGFSGLVGHARYNYSRWKDHRTDSDITERTMRVPTNGVSAIQQDMVAGELGSPEIDFLTLTDRLCVKANQIDKYTKQWLVGRRRINMDKLERLLQEAYTAAYSAYTALNKSRLMHENNM